MIKKVRMRAARNVKRKLVRRAGPDGATRVTQGTYTAWQSLRERVSVAHGVHEEHPLILKPRSIRNQRHRTRLQSPGSADAVGPGQFRFGNPILLNTLLKRGSGRS